MWREYHRCADSLKQLKPTFPIRTTEVYEQSFAKMDKKVNLVPAGIQTDWAGERIDCADGGRMRGDV